uniref:Fukutin n=1 Tax=Timema bartmani TaxID=61472 RepID=A0A7R9F290_9NEOP|nr:unnamed protein product [Timema bartmani]
MTPQGFNYSTPLTRRSGPPPSRSKKDVARWLPNWRQPLAVSGEATPVSLRIHQPNWYASPTRLRVCHFPVSLLVPHRRLYSSSSTKTTFTFPYIPPTETSPASVSVPLPVFLSSYLSLSSSMSLSSSLSLSLSSSLSLVSPPLPSLALRLFSICLSPRLSPSALIYSSLALSEASAASLSRNLQWTGSLRISPTILPCTSCWLAPHLRHTKSMKLAHRLRTLWSWSLRNSIHDDTVNIRNHVTVPTNEIDTSSNLKLRKKIAYSKGFKGRIIDKNFIHVQNGQVDLTWTDQKYLDKNAELPLLLRCCGLPALTITGAKWLDFLRRQISAPQISLDLGVIECRKICSIHMSSGPLATWPSFPPTHLYARFYPHVLELYNTRPFYSRADREVSQHVSTTRVLTRKFSQHVFTTRVLPRKCLPSDASLLLRVKNRRLIGGADWLAVRAKPSLSTVRPHVQDTGAPHNFRGEGLSSMRFTPTRLLLYICVLIIIIVIWTLFKKSQTIGFTRTCPHPEQFQDQLHQLADKVNRVLSSLQLTHFLCYGSLWGQIRLSRSLPWEADVEFCLLNEELSLHDEVFLTRAFKKHKLDMKYNSAEGLYMITDPQFEGGNIQLIVFEEDTTINMLRRVGWKRRMLPPNCEEMTSLECFPPRLIARPLPLKEFGGLNPGPSGQIEARQRLFGTALAAERSCWRAGPPRQVVILEERTYVIKHD